MRGTRTVLRRQVAYAPGCVVAVLRLRREVCKADGAAMDEGKLNQIE
jgi:hypothetical protein